MRNGVAVPPYRTISTYYINIATRTQNSMLWILSAYCEVKGLLPEAQCGFRPDRSTTDMMFVVRRLQEVGRKAGVSLFVD